MDNLTGQIFLNRFRVDDFISSEAGYYRYRGFDLKRNLALTIRAFDQSIAPDASVLCFQQNNLTLQTIMHPNIVPFYGLYEDHGMSFVIEKFIDGPLLAHVLNLRNKKPIPPADTLIYIKALGTALGYIHGFGLVHCTVSPIHIQTTRDGSLTLANFGFSRTISKAMSKTGVFGLPYYLAPEQFRGESVFPSTDIYSLGILMFELLSGFHPFLGISSGQVNKGEDVAEKLRQSHLNLDLAQVSQSIPNLHAGLAEAILTATKKNPKERYQSAQEMLEICCAVMGTTPRQVPDRLGGRPPVQPTQIIQPGSQDGGAGNQFQTQSVIGGTSAAPMGIPPSKTEREVQRGVQGAPAGSVPSNFGTQVVARETWGTAQPGSPPPAPPQTGYSTTAPKAGRPSWLLPAIGLLAGLFILCIVVGVWVGVPLLKEMLATPTKTPNHTATLTISPTATLEQPTHTPVPTQTEPVILPPTEPLPPPTEIPIGTPTEVSVPTAPRTAFKVTVRNGLPQPIFVFRDGTLMGSDPIPPGMYIWYLNIPAGQHYFRFCYDMNQARCPQERSVMVDDDITISLK